MSEPFAILLVQEGNTTRRNWELETAATLIGRGTDCDIPIDERQISRHHAKITRQGDVYRLEDLGSKNGTFVNGQQLPPHVSHTLKDGDQIGIALGCRMVFVDADATAPLFIAQTKHPEIKMASATKQVWVAGKELTPPLSLAQFRLLELLFAHNGGVVSRDAIVTTVWLEEEADGVSEQAIDALARRLRERIAEADPDTGYVITVRGHGFRLEHFVE